MTVFDSRQLKWNEMVSSSKDAKEYFNEFADDRAIIWADSEMRNYIRAMLLLKNTNDNWAMNLSEEDEKFVTSMILRAESI